MDPTAHPDIRYEGEVHNLRRELVDLHDQRSRLEHYVGTLARRLGVANPADLRTDAGLERIGEAALAAVEQHADDAAAQREELEDLRMEQAQLRAEAADARTQYSLADARTQYAMWRLPEQPDSRSQGATYDRDDMEPFLARPDHWIVRSRTVRTWRGPWTDVAPTPHFEHPDVVAYLAERKANGEAPEHDAFRLERPRP